MKAYWGVEVWLHAFLISVLDGGEWSASRPGRFTPMEKTLVPTGQEADRSGHGGEENSQPLLLLEY
jgi:hypothetical protein